MPMSFQDSNYELVELTENAKEELGREYVPRPDYRDYPTKAVVVFTYGETGDDFWIQQRPPEGCKPLFWEVVAGSKAKRHDCIEDAAAEEVREELFGDDLNTAPEGLDLDYLGEVYKPTENPQKLFLFRYDSGRTGFPGSDEVYDGEFVSRKRLEEIIDGREFTDCSMYALEASGLLDAPLDEVDRILEDRVV